jgi:hypothetical protein
VANRKKIESYSTRSRAMMLWRIVSGRREWTPRGAELLYQSTLDSISEAFCVSDRPVSAYALAARRDVWRAGLAPTPVRDAVMRPVGTVPDRQPGERVLVAAECAEAGWTDQASAFADALGLDLLLMPVGATAYALGADDVAAAQAQAAAAQLGAARVLVADGPQTQWLLGRIWPDFGVEVGAEIVSLSAFAISELGDVLHAAELGDCYVVDTRAAAQLADGLALPVAIQPGYLGSPDDSGRGAIYDDLRTLLRGLGGREQRHRWERSLSRSSGADDGLWASYPDIATDLSVACLELAAAAGAQRIVTDSPLSAAWLGASADPSLPVDWIGELVKAG